MSQKFELSSWRTNSILHLKLLGEFDGSSACELVKKIKEDGSGASQIIVDTTEIRRVHLFGKIVLQNRLGQVSRRLVGLSFIGKHKHQFE